MTGTPLSALTTVLGNRDSANKDELNYEKYGGCTNDLISNTKRSESKNRSFQQSIKVRASW